MDHKIALPEHMQVTDEALCLFALRIPKDKFASIENHGGLTCILTQIGTFFLRRDEGMTVRDAITALNHHCGFECTHLVGCLGERHQMQMLCPDVAVCEDVEASPNDLQLLDFVTIEVNDMDVQFSAGFKVLRDFCAMLEITGIDEIMTSFGWMFVTDAFETMVGRVGTARLMQKPGCFAITFDEIIFFLALQFFLVKIRSWASLGANPTARCRMQLWHVTISWTEQ